MEGKLFLNLVLILCFDIPIVQSSLDAGQVYSLLSNRISVEVTIIKYQIEEMKSDFEGKLHSLEKQILNLDGKLGHKDTVSGTDSNENSDNHVSDHLDDDKIKTQITVMKRAFKEEKKYIRLFQENMNRSLEEYKTSVHDLIENIREEGKKDLDAMSNNISAAQLRQMDEITKLKDEDIRNSKSLDDVAHQQREFDNRVANTEHSYTELNETLNDRKIAFEDYKISVHNLIENIREEGKKDLKVMSSNVSATQSRQLDEITKLKDEEIRNSRILDDLAHKQRTLDSRVANTEHSYTKLKGTLNSRKIAFSSAVMKNQATKPGDIILFDGVLFQTGGGYDASSGTFKCPRTGVYLFYVTLVCEARLKETNTLAASLKVDNNLWVNIVSKSTEREQYCSEGSNMVIKHVREGQTVSVVTYYGKEASVMKYMSTFSGMLLY